MKWRQARRSDNVIDRRGGGQQRRGGGGGVGGIAAIVVLLVGLFFGVDISGFVGGGSSGGSWEDVSSAPEAGRDDAAGQFVAAVLGTTEDIWAQKFQEELGRPYRPAELVLFSGATQSRCGAAQSASGPFYCPADQRIYMDTNFFNVLAGRLGAGGDFAAAYVVAHEVAHHIQKQLDILDRANTIRAQSSQAESNAISVRIELQADCLSGIWAREAAQRGYLERGDLSEALNAARQIGDDTLARNAGRSVNPHTFTHGSSAQRERWFQIGFETGSILACDTFSTDRL